MLNIKIKKQSKSSMKNIFLFILLIGLYSCDVNDCFESTGKIIQKEIELDLFEKIEVGNEVTLTIKQGTTQKVVIETGENLIDNVTIEVIDGELFIKDESSCNLSRDYAVTKVFITSPNIKIIRSNTARLIKSDGVLNYNNLILISEDFNKDALNIGDFNISINSQTLSITSNGSSLFTIKGNVQNLQVGFHSGSTRFIGKELIANNVNIIQKSSNDILINPQNQIKGNIYSIGDVISYNHPPTVEVEEHYSGKLIFE